MDKNLKQSLVKSSFKYCEGIAKKHYENFPVASLLIPRPKRNYIYSIYAFARAADDFADENYIEGGKEKRLALLDDWNKKLTDCFNDKCYDPIFIALNSTVNDCNIPIEPLDNLLKAFKQDVVKNRYENFEEVLSYCENSANPVGRLVLIIFGNKDEELFKYSDKICTALQLTNFWQDVKIDLQKDRIYLPQNDMKTYGYSEEDLNKNIFNDNFKHLMKFEVERTEKIFEEGKKLIELTGNNDSLRQLSSELKLTLLGGKEILNKIKENNYDVFNKRPKITAIHKLKLFTRSRIA